MTQTDPPPPSPPSDSENPDPDDGRVAPAGPAGPRGDPAAGFRRRTRRSGSVEGSALPGPPPSLPGSRPRTARRAPACGRLRCPSRPAALRIRPTGISPRGAARQARAGPAAGARTEPRCGETPETVEEMPPSEQQQQQQQQQGQCARARAGSSQNGRPIVLKVASERRHGS